MINYISLIIDIIPEMIEYRIHEFWLLPVSWMQRKLHAAVPHAALCYEKDFLRRWSLFRTLLCRISSAERCSCCENGDEHRVSSGGRSLRRRWQSTMLRFVTFFSLGPHSLSFSIFRSPFFSITLQPSNPAIFNGSHPSLLIEADLSHRFGNQRWNWEITPCWLFQEGE